MAGDWIKMRGNLWDDPRVSALCDMTDSSEASIVGGLYWLWATADQHTEDGVLPGLTTKGIDRKTGIKGFGDALVDIGWIADEVDGIRIVRFDEHNGTSAKRRCMEAQRKANSRIASACDADNKETQGGQNPPDCGAREREEKEKSQQPISEQTGESSRSTPPAKPAASPRGSRLKTDFKLPKTWGDWALQERKDWNAETVRLVAEKFRDHWIAKPGKEGTKLDWEATWRNWVRSESTRAPPGSPTSAISAPKRQCCGKNDDGTPCSGHVEGEIMGRPWCRKHQEYAMDNSNFRQREAA